MENRGRELPSDLVHVGQHQHQPLGGRECRRQCAGLQSAMRGTRCTALALHFDDVRYLPPDILLSGSGPDIGIFGHRGRWGYRVDRANFADRIGNPGDSLIPFERSSFGHDEAPLAADSSNMSIAWQGHCS